jgi:hypothetical protein
MITPQEIADSIAFTFSIANKWDLGQHLYGEVEKAAADGKSYIINMFAGGGVVVEKGHYAATDGKYFDRKTFAISDSPPGNVIKPPEILPPPGVINPARLTALPNGLRVVPYVPRPGEAFWGLVQAGSWKLNVGTELIVITRNAQGSVFDVPVVNAFGASSYEQHMSDGNGTVRFDFGPGSGYSAPALPPNQIYVSWGDGVPGELWPAARGDKVLFGFPGGAHLEGTITFQLMTA